MSVVAITQPRLGNIGHTAFLQIAYQATQVNTLVAGSTQQSANHRLQQIIVAASIGIAKFRRQ